tara:strand:+ start:1286 stop:1708 length:423 start_codon:yes stop_codon:yes gene_type:complete
MIKFNFATDFVLQNERTINRLLVFISSKEDRTISKLHYHFVSKSKIIEINKSHLSHDYSTDVITFDYSDANTIIAEAFICPEETLINAEVFYQSIEDEMLRVVIHALLHLCGYDDKTKLGSSEMRAKEDFYINEYHTSFK